MREPLRWLHARFPEARVLALGKPIPGTELCGLIFLGVDGFLPYPEVERHFRPAIRAIAAGRPWLPTETVAQYIAYSRTARAQTQLKLAGRELEALRMVARGLSNKEMSAQMRISERTVKYHLSNACRKLGVNNRHAAAERAKAMLSATP